MNGALLAVLLAAALMWIPADASAKDTGLIFVSNEKSNNLMVIDPKTYKVIKDIKTSRRLPLRIPPIQSGRDVLLG